jgi:two-component system cell cycle sensor histidine kinase PleC
MEMPVMHGLQLIEAIRARPALAQLPIIVVTSRDDMMMIDRAFEVGASSFATKPVNWRLLQHAVPFVVRAVQNEAEARAARDAAVQLGEAKGQFLDIVRHELRTPLNHILGFARLARDHARAGATERLEDSLDEVVRAGEKLSRTVRDASLYLDLLAGRVVPERRRECCDWLLESFVELRHAALAAAGVTVSARPSSGAEVMVDARHLQMIAGAVLDNVLAHASGATAVTLSCHVADGHATLELRDNGCGIPAGQRDACLTALQQRDMSRSRSGEGLGLGLSLAGGLTVLNGGSLALAEAEGGGLAVRLRFPLAR